MVNRNDLYTFIDVGDPHIRSLYMSWDKGDCSVIGLLRILLIQEIRNEIKERGQYYDGMYDEILDSLYKKYQT